MSAILDEITDDLLEDDRWFRIAVTGSLVLAIPGAMGAVGLVLLLMLAVTGPPDPNVVAGTLAAMVGAATGFYLLVGYRRDRAHSVRAARRLWWLSAAYNGAGAALSAVQLVGHALHALHGLTLAPVLMLGTNPARLILVIAGLFWTLFMATISVSRARQANRQPSREGP